MQRILPNDGVPISVYYLTPSKRVAAERNGPHLRPFWTTSLKRPRFRPTAAWWKRIQARRRMRTLDVPSFSNIIRTYLFTTRIRCSAFPLLTESRPRTSPFSRERMKFYNDPSEYSGDTYSYDRLELIWDFKENKHFREVHNSLNGLIAYLEIQQHIDFPVTLRTVVMYIPSGKTQDLPQFFADISCHGVHPHHH